MALFEDSVTPGAPYLVASFLSLWAFLHCFDLPVETDIVFSKHLSKRRGLEEANGLLVDIHSDSDSDDNK
jgi:hypothetical protein